MRKCLPPISLSALTADQVNSVSDTKLDDPTIVGKLVNGYGWYLAVVADNSKKLYAIGDTLKLRFEASAELYDAEITDINDDAARHRAL